MVPVRPYMPRSTCILPSASADAVVRMLHFNAPPSANGRAAPAATSEEEFYKVLVLDAFTKDVLAPLLRVNDLRRHGVTLHLLLEVGHVHRHSCALPFSLGIHCTIRQHQPFRTAVTVQGTLVNGDVRACGILAVMQCRTTGSRFRMCQLCISCVAARQQWMRWRRTLPGACMTRCT